MQLEKNFTKIQILLLLLGVGLSLFYASHQILTGDQTQMIYKGYMAAYKDIWINYGNAASAVGNVPGSMLTYVVAFPVMLVDSPYAPMLLLITLHLISYLLFESVFKEIFSVEMRLMFLVLYWLNPWFVFENILYNPSYLFFFAALHFYSAYKQRHSSSFWYSFLHILSIGLAMQFHYSWIILALISLYLLYKKMVKVHWLGVAVGVIVLGISLIPYIEAVMQNSSITKHAEDTGRYIGWGGVHVYPVLKSFLYWLRYGSFFFPNKLIMSAHFEWLTTIHLLQLVVTYLYKAVVILVGAISVYIAYRANRALYEKLKGKFFLRHWDGDAEEWIELYIFGAFFGVFVSSVLSPIIFSYWHLLIVFVFAMLPVLLYIKPLLQEHFSKLFGLTLLYFIIVNSVGAIDSRKYNYSVNYAEDVKAYVKEHVTNE